MSTHTTYCPRLKIYWCTCMAMAALGRSAVSTVDPIVEVFNVDVLAEDGRRLGCFSVVPDAEGLESVTEVPVTVWKETTDPAVARSLTYSKLN